MYWKVACQWHRCRCNVSSVSRILQYHATPAEKCIHRLHGTLSLFYSETLFHCQIRRKKAASEINSHEVHVWLGPLLLPSVSWTINTQQSTTNHFMFLQMLPWTCSSCSLRISQVRSSYRKFSQWSSILAWNLVFTCLFAITIKTSYWKCVLVLLQDQIKQLNCLSIADEIWKVNILKIAELFFVHEPI